MSTLAHMKITGDNVAFSSAIPVNELFHVAQAVRYMYFGNAWERDTTGSLVRVGECEFCLIDILMSPYLSDITDDTLRDVIYLLSALYDKEYSGGAGNVYGEVLQLFANACKPFHTKDVPVEYVYEHPQRKSYKKGTPAHDAVKYLYYAERSATKGLYDFDHCNALVALRSTLKKKMIDILSVK